MSYQGLPEKLVVRINPIDARDYATASGWKRVPNLNGKLAVYSHTKSDLDQLLIPLDSGMVDYGHRMAEMIASLAEDEGRPATEILNNLLMPPSDVLRFCVDEPRNEAGLVPLVQGIDLLEGARKLILASACSVVQPRAFHPRLSRAEPEQLLQACRLGQTERGSFTAVIACPLDAVGGEPIPAKPMPLFQGQAEANAEPGEGGVTPVASPDPFTRRTTSLLMRSVARIVSAVDADRLDSMLDPDEGHPPLSANLCEALMMMQPSGDRSRLSILATWARTLPPAPGEFPPSAVNLRRDYFPIIEKLAVALRPAREPRTSYFVGLVDALFGNPDETNQVSGEVQLMLLNQEGNIKARVNLNAAEYHVAWEAHNQGGYVSLHGILHPGERVHRIESVSSFKLLKD